ncbi:hypothetical protein ABVV53_15675 [Novosphingobium sp. RD2P27]|uniref:Uncharacterized protein n=1 Tax=Novosphingobium kalidii TaxID=3230299 RepID=A0ABV2D4U5_9SPHN
MRRLYRRGLCGQRSDRMAGDTIRAGVDFAILDAGLLALAVTNANARRG